MSSSGGLGSSRWSTPGRMNRTAGPLQQVQNFASATLVPNSKPAVPLNQVQDFVAAESVPNSKPFVLRQLQQAGANTKIDVGNIHEATDAIVPPHLRGINTQPSSWNGPPNPASKQALGPSHVLTTASTIVNNDHLSHGTQTATHPLPPHLRTAPLNHGMQNATHLPPHLQAASSSATVHQERTPVKAPTLNNGTQNTPAQLSGQEVQRASAPAAVVQEEQLPPSTQHLSGAGPQGSDFLSWVNDKMAAKADAKKNNAVEKAAVASQASADRAARYNNFAIPTADSDNAFKSFITDALEAPPVNGKKYTFTGGAQPTETTSAASKHVTQVAPAGPKPATQVAPVAPKQARASSAQRPHLQGPKLSGSPLRNEVDPHAAFSPGDKAKNDPAVRFEDVARLKAPEAAEAVAPVQATCNVLYQQNPANPVPASGFSSGSADEIFQIAADDLVAPGFSPAASSIGYEDKVSDSGVEELNPKENVRATEGHETELLDWDGRTWLPAPDWGDRQKVNYTFTPRYIRQEWVHGISSGVVVNTQDPEFDNAVPVEIGGHYTPLEHPLTIPDLANSQLPNKQRVQTSHNSMQRRIRELERELKNEEARVQYQEQQARDFELYLQTRVEEEHPYKPKIDVYLRPANENDAKGIAEIYNHWVLNSLTTEDQVTIPVEKLAFLINFTRSEKLPFIVAVKGKMPPSPPVKSYQAKKATVPQYENIIGFGYAETSCYGLGGSTHGRSRYTAYVHFFVHPDHLKVRVGQSLLDRLIQSLSFSYGAKDGYDWMNPANDPVYQPGGVRRVHQMIIRYAIERSNDPTYEWMKNFLQRYYVDEQGRLPSAARSHATIGPGAKFCDVVFFCKELQHEGNFGAQI